MGSRHCSELQHHEDEGGNQKLTANHAVGQIFMLAKKKKVRKRK